MKRIKNKAATSKSLEVISALVPDFSIIILSVFQTR